MSDSTQHTSGLPLDTLGKMIIANLDKADQALTRSKDLRLAAGQHLLEAQERVKAGEAGDIGWTAWCAANVPEKSQRYIQLLIAPHRSDDPEAALAVQRDSARTSMAKTRANANNVVRMEVITQEQLAFARAKKLNAIYKPSANVKAAISEAGLDQLPDNEAESLRHTLKGSHSLGVLESHSTKTIEQNLLAIVNYWDTAYEPTADALASLDESDLLRHVAANPQRDEPSDLLTQTLPRTELLDNATDITKPVLDAILEAGIPSTDDLLARIRQAQSVAAQTATSREEIEAAGIAVVMEEEELLTKPFEEPAPIVCLEDLQQPERFVKLLARTFTGEWDNETSTAREQVRRFMESDNSLMWSEILQPVSTMRQGLLAPIPTVERLRAYVLRQQEKIDELEAIIKKAAKQAGFPDVRTFKKSLKDATSEKMAAD